VRHQKRKAETDNASRRIRPREDQDSDSAESTSSREVNSTSSRDIDDQPSLQDIDDQPSQPSRVISVQLRVPTDTEGRYGDVIERMIVAADREDRGGNRRRDPPEDPYGGYVLGWRIDSPTTTERRRSRMRHPNGRSVHTSELQGIFQGLYQERGARDYSSKEGETMES